MRPRAPGTDQVVFALDGGHQSVSHSLFVFVSHFETRIATRGTTIRHLLSHFDTAA